MDRWTDSNIGQSTGHKQPHKLHGWVVSQNISPSSLIQCQRIALKFVNHNYLGPPIMLELALWHSDLWTWIYQCTSQWSFLKIKHIIIYVMNCLGKKHWMKLSNNFSLHNMKVLKHKFDYMHVCLEYIGIILICGGECLWITKIWLVLWR
jgi:hypothetical protein